MQARYFAAAAAASQQVSSFSTLDMQPAEGRLVEYKRNMRTGLALLLHPDGKQNWSAIDTRCAAQVTPHGMAQSAYWHLRLWSPTETAQHGGCRIKEAFCCCSCCRLSDRVASDRGTTLREAYALQLNNDVRCTRKNTFSLKPAQLSFFLPGAGYTEEDLQRVQQLSDSSTDYELLQLAWEVWHQPVHVWQGLAGVSWCGLVEKLDSLVAQPICTLQQICVRSASASNRLTH